MLRDNTTPQGFIQLVSSDYPHMYLQLQPGVDASQLLPRVFMLPSHGSFSADQSAQNPVQVQYQNSLNQPFFHFSLQPQTPVQTQTQGQLLEQSQTLAQSQSQSQSQNQLQLQPFQFAYPESMLTAPASLLPPVHETIQRESLLQTDFTSALASDARFSPYLARPTSIFVPPLQNLLHDTPIMYSQASEQQNSSHVSLPRESVAQCRDIHQLVEAASAISNAALSDEREYSISYGRESVKTSSSLSPAHTLATSSSHVIRREKERANTQPEYTHGNTAQPQGTPHAPVQLPTSKKVVKPEPIRPGSHKTTVKQEISPSYLDNTFPVTPTKKTPKRKKATEINPYIAYCTLRRAQVRRENPFVTNREILLMVGEMWRSETEEEKRRYEAIAREMTEKNLAKN